MHQWPMCRFGGLPVRIRVRSHFLAAASASALPP